MGYGQREAAELTGRDPRLWGTDTLGFAGDEDGNVVGVQVRGTAPGSEQRSIPAQLVFVAKGFTGPEQSVLDAFAGFQNVHVAGDARMGSTLVATAIADGIQVASSIACDLVGR